MVDMADVGVVADTSVVEPKMLVVKIRVDGVMVFTLVTVVLDSAVVDDTVPAVVNVGSTVVGTPMVVKQFRLKHIKYNFTKLPNDIIDIDLLIDKHHFIPYLTARYWYVQK